MRNKAHYNPKSLKWLISLAIMVVLSVAVIVCTIAINNANNEKNNAPVELGFTISSVTPFATETNEFDVTSVDKAYDEKGNLVAYVIGGTVVGYNQESPIEMKTTITADASVVCGIEIVNQEETEYLGVRIQGEDFTNQFKGKKLPIKNSASISKGSSVDLIAKSTISSQAVVDGVNNAQKYAESFLVNK